MDPQPVAEDHSSSRQQPLFTGACFCKAVKFTLSSLPTRSYICHCLDCRQFTGTSFVHNIMFPFSSLSVSSSAASDSMLVLVPDSAATSQADDFLSTFGSLEAGRRQFCRKCGSGLFFFTKVEAGKEAEEVIVQAGSIYGSHEDERLRPTHEGYCKRREAWMPDMKGTVTSAEW